MAIERVENADPDLDRLGSYDLAWKGAVIIGLIAGSFQMLMNVRPPKAKNELAGALPEAA